MILKSGYNADTAILFNSSCILNLCRESIAQDDIFATMNSRVESRPTVDDDFCQWKSGDMICVDEIIRIQSLWIKYNRYGFNQPLGLHTSFPADLL